MDFRQTTQPSNPRPAVVTPTPAPVANQEHKEHGAKKPHDGKWWLRFFNAIVLIGVAVLLAGIALAFTRGGNHNEAQYVNSSKYQAVFLNNGQVYFGNIKKLNDSYLRLTNVFYLTQTNGTSTDTNGNYSLVKLGCQQIHDPYDEMMINRAQVTFWENLQDDGKVVASINEFKKQNPKGPDCTQVSNQTQASNTPTQGGTGTTGTGTTGTDTTKTNE